MLRQHLDALNLTASAANPVNDLVFDCNSSVGGATSFTAKDMLVVDAHCVSPGALGDPNAPYVVRLVDSPWAVQTEFYATTATKAYTLRAPAAGNYTYSQST